MTAFRAVVRYALPATRDEVVAALRDGLEYIACELVERHGLSLRELEDALDAAYDQAEYAAAEVRS